MDLGRRRRDAPFVVYPKFLDWARDNQSFSEQLDGEAVLYRERAMDRIIAESLATRRFSTLARRVVRVHSMVALRNE